VGQEVFSFIPEETFIAESFGEYPFTIKLAPTSIIARKLQLMAVQMLNPEKSLLKTYAPCRKFESKSFRRRIRRAVISAEGRNTRNIIQAFGLAVTVLTIFLAAYALTAIWFLIKNFTNASYSAYDAITQNVPFLVAATLTSIVFSIYAVKAQFGLMFYYRDQYRFRRALLRALGRRPNLWERLTLARMWTLRVGNSVLPVLILTIPSAVAIVVIVVELFSVLTTGHLR
jgi:hypothetical protein